VGSETLAFVKKEGGGSMKKGMEGVEGILISVEAAITTAPTDLFTLR
jgi:hypothetical protein